MFSVALSTRLTLLAASAALAVAQTTGAPPAQATFPAVPHASKKFTWPNLPYKVDTDTNLIRGVQHGFNICNETTLSQTSNCQTAHFNSIDDFCIWGPPDYGREVGDIEGIMVAWCTKPTHGTRLIPKDALTGVQWIKTKSYVQAVGFLDQTKINVLEGDWGGEMDPHGADLRGNPMGGLLFSDAFNGNPTQVIQWHLFLGGNRFCFKACDPADPDDRHYCEHIYDRIGCDYNIPNAAKDGVFEECEGDVQDFPGTYVENGQTITYRQPEGPITTIPYVARTPSSSNCTPYTSSLLYSQLPAASGNPAVSSATPTAGPSGSASGSAKPSGLVPSRSVPAGSTPPSGTAGNSAKESETGGAASMAVSGASIFGVLLSALVLA